MSGGRLKRRDFVAVLAATLATGAPVVSRAQPRSRGVVGFLGAGSAIPWRPYVAAFRDGLRAEGYIEGRNVVVEFRWAEGRYERLTALAADLVRRNVDVIVATGGIVPIRAARAATKTIPIVFSVGNDPIELGIVTNLARPEGNVTGIALFAGDLLPKRLELLDEIVPRAAKIGVLINPTNPGSALYSKQVEAAARALSRAIDVVNAATEGDLDTAFEQLTQRRAGGLLVSGDPFFDGQRNQIARLILRYTMPTIQNWREDVEAGGLMSYGASLVEGYRQAGVYAAKILNGVKPADLPIQQPSKLDLVVNLKTARALGLTLPPALLARADEVIE
jgi:putative tryptophan/tyrosine transport system substrate-binding protein